MINIMIKYVYYWLLSCVFDTWQNKVTLMFFNYDVSPHTIFGHDIVQLTHRYSYIENNSNSCLQYVIYKDITQFYQKHFE